MDLEAKQTCPGEYFRLWSSVLLPQSSGSSSEYITPLHSPRLGPDSSMGLDSPSRLPSKLSKTRSLPAPTMSRLSKGVYAANKSPGTDSSAESTDTVDTPPGPAPAFSRMETLWHEVALNSQKV